MDEFEALCIKADSAHPAQLGLQHMRAALCAYNGSSPPPHGLSLCSTHHGPPYSPFHSLNDGPSANKQDSFERYRQAVVAHSALLSREGVVITPVIPAPCPMKLAATLSSEPKHMEQTGHSLSIAGGGAGTTPTKEGEAALSPSLVVGGASPSSPLMDSGIAPSSLPQLSGGMSNLLSTPPPTSREVTPELSGASTRATPICSAVGVAHSTPKVCTQGVVT